MAIITLSPNPAIEPSIASIVFFILETTLFNSTTSLDFKDLMSITAIEYPSLNVLSIGVTSSYVLRTNVFTETLESFCLDPVSISIKSDCSVSFVFFF